mmetsp:Transcript_27665/g.41949  ORF Transcript_27665/g.41949 Transcript_27665/m.41949 type:complete len:230 (-) Transcript_27665:172-861(-)
MYSFSLTFLFTSIITQFKERDSGIRKQLILSGVKYHHFFWSDFIYDFSHVAAGSLVFVVGTHFMSINVDGLWLPMLLFSISGPIFIYFIMALTSRTQRLFTLLVAYAALTAVCATGTILVSFMATTVGQITVARIIEAVLCLNPAFAGPFSFIKLLYRVQFQAPDAEERSISSFGLNGCLIEIIGMLFGIVFYSTMTFALNNKWFEKHKLNDGLSNRVEASQESQELEA